jgi:hypothetical protein
VFDYDLVSSNDIIGVVYIDLNCLLMEDSPGQIAGWFPIYDNIRGMFQYSINVHYESMWLIVALV